MGCSRPISTPWVNRYRQLSTRLGHYDPPFFDTKSQLHKIPVPELISQNSNSLYSYIIISFDKIGIITFVTQIFDSLTYR